MAKRKGNNDKSELKRLKVENDSELWGDSDDEQLMCDAVDEYERLNQLGNGEPALSQQSTSNQQTEHNVQAALNNEFAGEKDLWGDSDDEQEMCDAVDEYERLNQIGHGEPH